MKTPARLWILVWTLGLVLLNQLCVGQAPGPAPAPKEDPLSAQIGRALLQQTLGSWWGEVVVVRDGKVIFAQGYGLADENLKPMTPDSLVDVGDLAKQFTAVGVLRLEQAGKLSVDDPIGKYFPDAPEKAKAITLRHILSNTSGFGDRVPLGTVDDMDRDKLVTAIIESPVQHEPGTVFDYCNRAYAIAAAIIEKVSGRPYDEYMRDEVFRPAGLTSTGFLDGEGLDAGRKTARMASLRVGAKKAPLFAPAVTGGWSWSRRGTTGVVSTANDLARWDAVLRTGLLLNDQERQKLLTPVQESYGLSWYIHTTPRATKRVWHGAYSPGYKMLFVSLLDEATTMIVITNEMGEPDAIVGVIEEMLFPPLPEGAKATLNVKGMQFQKDPDGYVLEEKVNWVATGTNDGGVELTMYRASNSLLMASLALKEGTARRCLASMTDIIRFTAESDQPTITGISVGQRGVPEDGTLDYPSVFKVEVRSAFRGRNKDGSEYNDRRPTLVMVDAGGTVPLIVRMDKRDAEQFRDVLSKALGVGPKK
jgi:CubicO group peptidase (beta-lactamase class C family)